MITCLGTSWMTGRTLTLISSAVTVPAGTSVAIIFVSWFEGYDPSPYFSGGSTEITLNGTTPTQINYQGPGSVSEWHYAGYVKNPTSGNFRLDHPSAAGTPGEGINGIVLWYSGTDSTNPIYSSNTYYVEGYNMTATATTVCPACGMTVCDSYGYHSSEHFGDGASYYHMGDTNGQTELFVGGVGYSENDIVQKFESNEIKWTNHVADYPCGIILSLRPAADEPPAGGDPNLEYYRMVYIS